MNPIVTFEMENGKIMKAELYPEIAPNTVKNFIDLAYKGFYDELIFHRVILRVFYQWLELNIQIQRVLNFL